jgi:hypothetical protein
LQPEHFLGGESMATGVNHFSSGCVPLFTL